MDNCSSIINHQPFLLRVLEYNLGDLYTFRILSCKEPTYGLEFIRYLRPKLGNFLEDNKSIRTANNFMNYILKLCGGSDNPDMLSCNEVYMYQYVSSHIYFYRSSKTYTFTFFLLISKV